MPATKEIIADVVSVSVWTSRTPRLVSRTGVDRRTPVNIGNSICIFEPPPPVLIEIIGTAPPCGLNASQEFVDKRQSTSPGLVRQSQKLNTFVDRKLSDDRDLTSIFSKVIGDKLSKGSRRDLYTCCRMNFAADPVSTQTPTFVDLGLSTINALDEGSGLSTPTNIIQRPTDGAHWSAPNKCFGETIAVGVSEENSDYNYNYKTEFQV